MYEENNRQRGLANSPAQQSTREAYGSGLPSAPEPLQREVDTRIKAAYRAAQGAKEMLDTLKERLLPVLRNEPLGEMAEPGPAPCVTMVGANIADIEWKLELLAADIRDLLNRLEV